ncbi:hypothetical protein ZIOFF_037142 [Zingiber officinale]|uniref:Trehalose 6-phosphate phosphatase n=1 Tax=Zingiber officinale TaxID=94328 RepID=A0A8J5GB43_ZINOF|nr:hypothetical protein ZIOFF_037142 [Zingiber officinale]
MGHWRFGFLLRRAGYTHHSLRLFSSPPPPSAVVVTTAAALSIIFSSGSIPFSSFLRGFLQIPLLMTKQNVVPVEAVAAITVARSSPLFPYTPPLALRKKFLPQIELEGGKTGSWWLDSMRASSPTHAKATAAAAGPIVDAVLDDLSDLTMRRPSALSKFDQIVSSSNGKQIVMFLDYDGTLSPIVDDPDSAFMTNAVSHPSPLSRLSPPPFDPSPASKDAILIGFSSPDEEGSEGSGEGLPHGDRERTMPRQGTLHLIYRRYHGRLPCFFRYSRGSDGEQVIDFVRLAELYYAGSHGMDIKGPEKSRHAKSKAANGVSFQPASEFLPMIGTVYKTLLDRTKSTPGAKVENNKFCVSVHFRCVDEKNWGALFEQVRSVLKEYPKLRLTQGRKVLEIRPTIKWDKGKALEFLLESLGFANCRDVMPIYIGDDRTDEDAFKVLRDSGQGIGILVSKFPKETNATYYLQEPSEASAMADEPSLCIPGVAIRVKDFLVRLVEGKRRQTKARSKV